MVGHLDHLVDAIYESALEPARWDEVLQDCSAQIGAQGAFLYCRSLTQRSFDILGRAGTVDDGKIGTYLDCHTKDNPWERRYKFQPEGEPFNPGVLAYSKDYRRTSYFNEWVRPQGFGDLIGCHLLRSGGNSAFVAFRREDKLGVYRAAELRAARSIIAHVARAVRLWTRSAAASAADAGWMRALDVAGLALVVVDGRAKILRANELAEGILSAQDGLCAQGGVLTARSPRETSRLHAAIDAAGRLTLVPDNLTVDIHLRRNEQRPLVAHVFPLTARRHLTQLGRRSPAVGLLVIDPERRRMPCIAGFASIYGLTPAESRLLCQMTGGGTLVSAARALGCGTATARTHLQRIFAKTGTSRQVELLRLVLESSLRSG